MISFMCEQCPPFSQHVKTSSLQARWLVSVRPLLAKWRPAPRASRWVFIPTSCHFIGLLNKALRFEHMMCYIIILTSYQLSSKFTKWLEYEAILLPLGYMLFLNFFALLIFFPQQYTQLKFNPEELYLCFSPAWRCCCNTNLLNTSTCLLEGLHSSIR